MIGSKLCSYQFSDRSSTERTVLGLPVFIFQWIQTVHWPKLRLLLEYLRGTHHMELIFYPICAVSYTCSFACIYNFILFSINLY
jgi:hypothetical protein